MERWTALDIEVMLHHYYSPAPFPRCTSPAYYDTAKALYESGLIYPEGEDIWRATQLGVAFVKAICRTPIPEQVFIDPRTKEFLGDNPGKMQPNG